MYLHLSKIERDALYVTLLEKQVSLCDRCEELLKAPEFDAAAYNDCDFSSRLLGRVIEQIEDLTN